MLAILDPDLQLWLGLSWIRIQSTGFSYGSKSTALLWAILDPDPEALMWAILDPDPQP